MIEFNCLPPSPPPVTWGTATFVSFPPPLIGSQFLDYTLYTLLATANSPSVPKPPTPPELVPGRSTFARVSSRESKLREYYLN